MKEEITAAVNFLTCLVGKNTDIPKEQVQIFQCSLDSILTEKFEGHWFPEQPNKGQAYRCIRVNSSVPFDSTLEQAARRSGLRYENLKLPVELTVWVDPQEVCCRFGESSGSFFTIASFKDDKENLPGKIQSDKSQIVPAINQESPDTVKKQKNRKKTVSDRPKKQVSSRNPSVPHIFVKSFPPKHPFSQKNMSFNASNAFDWSPSASPLTPHSSGYLDFSIMRRSRKAVRSIYFNDRYHWARK